MMPRVVVIYYDWKNTAGNHTGMAYFARAMKIAWGKKVRLIRSPINYGRLHNKFQWLWRYLTIRYLKIRLRPGDIIFFMEYLGGRISGDHRAIALHMRALGINNKMVGMVHLPSQTLLKLYEKEYILTALDAIDRILVLGRNLERFFDKLGFSDKATKTFYYTDTDYYFPANKFPNSNSMIVIVMGSLYRNRIALKEIITRCPEITFEVCMGHDPPEDELEALENVRLHRFLSEPNLLEKMQSADVSLSVFDEMEGSNVIVTSLACGLPQVVSDVGSIRDYCSIENAFFCTEADEYVSALQVLLNDPGLRQRMGEDARLQAEKISLERSLAWYDNFFTTFPPD